MMIKNPEITCLSKAGKGINEDTCFASNFFAYVIDGATGLDNIRFKNGMSPAEWYTEELDKYLQNNLSNQEKSIIEILEIGASQIRNEYIYVLQLEGIGGIDPPSAAIAIIRMVKDVIQYYVLGDCPILVKNKDETFQIINDGRVSELDKSIITQMIKIHDERDIDVLDAVSHVKDKIAAQRQRKNTKNGYWILTMDGLGIPYGIVGTLKISAILKICLLTDGFSAYYDVFHLLPNYKEFLDRIEQETIENMYKTLRKQQELDPLCNKYPRFKPKDDATIVFKKFA
ncbi:MAG: protein phosphatase 2C domain-containing protein [Promethearchaeota archaeon]